MEDKIQVTTKYEEEYEEEYVHHVYDRIASHFSATRYKPWPVVHDFLSDLPQGAVGIDIGCGNGKYLNINPDISIIGSDRCENLVKIARGQTIAQDAITADILSLPHRSQAFDFAISIAVIHHLSSQSRRIDAIASILGMLKPIGEGKALLYVWALEQRTSRRGWDETSDQDVLVPWILSKPYSEPKILEVDSSIDTVALEERGKSSFLRYYHLYKKGELEADIISAGGKVLASGYEKDNWWAVMERIS